MLVKICGLRTAEHALAAAAAGADLLGFVFAPSRRRIDPAAAAAIAAELRAATSARPRLVGLFVNADPAEVNAIAAEVGLDLVQLSGDEPAWHAERIALPVIKAIRMDGSANEAAWLARLDQQPTTGDQGPPGWAGPDAGGPALVFGPSSLGLLVDAHVPGSYGGTGVTADWARAAALARRAPLLLAGGLTPANVAAAIAAVGPLGVDVSSGVETDGVKDPLKIEAFLGAARAAQ
ncbi:MAG TPA: phosphoribosylanthranilate isomerase [Chloroflexaceae bacterium]|nr:phosphoribosylanthranilate isomerase [Chloroflexaceae bacterium]